MNSKTILILLSVLSAGVALPIAAPLALDRQESSARQWNEEAVLARLQQRGVEATSVEEWNGYVRAFVEVDGRQVIQYFDAETLQQVNI